MLRTIILSGLYMIKTMSFVLPTSLYELNKQDDPWSKHIRATLQSSGYLPYDDTFMNDYLHQIYDIENYDIENYDYQLCECIGCLVNNHCVECLNIHTCSKLSGVYCE